MLKGNFSQSFVFGYVCMAVFVFVCFECTMTFVSICLPVSAVLLSAVEFAVIWHFQIHNYIKLITDAIPQYC